MSADDDGLLVHRVPYFSQWESAELVPEFLSGKLPASDDPRWRDSGAASAAEYEFWARRSCGIACLRMLLSWWRGGAPPAMVLVRECVQAGAYIVRDDGVDGLIYAPFCAYLRDRWQLAAEVGSPLDLRSCASAVGHGQFAMISVHPSVRAKSEKPERVGGHLVLVVGRWAGGLVVHNPSGLPGESQEFCRLTFDTLGAYFAGRGVLIGDAQAAAAREILPATESGHRLQRPQPDRAR